MPVADDGRQDTSCRQAGATDGDGAWPGGGHRPRTVVVASAFAADAARVALAREGIQGTRVLTVAALASRLAGGFAVAAGGEAVMEATVAALRVATPEDLGELASISGAPGFAKALARTIAARWRSGVSLHPNGPSREAAVARLEALVARFLPPPTLRPGSLVGVALGRLRGGARGLGVVEVRDVGDLDHCWRPMVVALAAGAGAGLTWRHGPRPVPEWVRAAGIATVGSDPLAPALSVEGRSDPRDEVAEAMRRVRALLASGVPAGDVAIAAADTRPYDDLVSAAAREAGVAVHFVRGRRVVETAAGQGAAALADLLDAGPDPAGMRRLQLALRGTETPLAGLPTGWLRFLSPAAKLASTEDWRRALAAGDAPADVAEPLLSAVAAIASGDVAAAAGLLPRGPAREAWRLATLRGSPGCLAAEVSDVRFPDPVQAVTAVAWTDAATLASCPRRHVMLLGLDSRSWPRREADDPLLPPRERPDDAPTRRPLADLDREAFATIVATTAIRVACSYPRRDARGRSLLPSDLLGAVPSTPVPGGPRVAAAMSEADRLSLRPIEFAATARGASTVACWRAWRSPTVTPHDGLVRAGHPAIARALGRVQSPASLRLLLRNPLGFLWRYALGWRAPPPVADAIGMDAAAFGSAAHAILDAATRELGAGPGLREADPRSLEEAVRRATAAVADGRASAGLPRDAAWSYGLEEAGNLARAALALPLPALPGERSVPEWRVGQASLGHVDADRACVPLEGTPFLLGGRVDRVDVSADGLHARVVDYKTGASVGEGVALGGGTEVQRCLYARAAAAALPPGAEVEGALLYPASRAAYRPLPDPEAAWSALRRALVAAHDGLLAGRALPGPDAGERHDPMAVALPAAHGSPLRLKREAARALMGDAAEIWSEP